MSRRSADYARSIVRQSLAHYPNYEWTLRMTIGYWLERLLGVRLRYWRVCARLAAWDLSDSQIPDDEPL